MSFGFDCCCLTCKYCQDNLPETIIAQISGIGPVNFGANPPCSTCGNLNGTYELISSLQYNGPYKNILVVPNPCTYVYQLDPQIICYPGNPDSGSWILLLFNYLNVPITSQAYLQLGVVYNDGATFGWSGINYNKKCLFQPTTLFGPVPPPQVGCGGGQALVTANP